MARELTRQALTAFFKASGDDEALPRAKAQDEKTVWDRVNEAQ